MSQIAVYPGSFDPVTRGHLDVAIRAASLFTELHIVVVHNPAKTPRFSSEERVQLIKASLAELNLRKSLQIVVDTLDGGLLVDLKGGEKIEVSRRQTVKFKEMMSL